MGWKSFQKIKNKLQWKVGHVSFVQRVTAASKKTPSLEFWKLAPKTIYRTQIMSASTSEEVRETASSSSRGDGGDKPNTKEEEKKEDNLLECNICLDTAKDAVVSLCGHLFCWPCLHQWLETRPNRQVCPVCKAAISRDKVVPLYGRGSTKQEDPRDKVPPRPAGQRTEPEPGNNFSGFGFGDGGFHMSFGIGAFPFGFFTSTFNFGEPRPNVSPHGTPQYMEEQFLSKVFLWLAMLFIAWLLLA